MTTPENVIIYHNDLCLSPPVQFLLGAVSRFLLPRVTEDSVVYAEFWSDKQRSLWYVMAFSGVVNYVRDFRYCIEHYERKI